MLNEKEVAGKLNALAAEFRTLMEHKDRRQDKKGQRKGMCSNTCQPPKWRSINLDIGYHSGIKKARKMRKTTAFRA